MSVLIVGFSGVTCGGKSTMTSEMRKLFPKSRVFYQDDYFFDEDDPRHIRCKEVDHINYDILTSMDMEKMYKDIVNTIGQKKLKNGNKQKYLYDRTQGDLYPAILEKLDVNDVELIILDGFLLLNYKPLLPFIALRYCFTLNKEECKKRREKRVYTPPDVPGYFETCVWPEYVKHLEEVKSYVSDVTYFGDEPQSPLTRVLNDIYNSL